MVNPDGTPPVSPVPGAGSVVFVPTPIGNLADITLRALDTLRQADLIACEDTRHTRILLDHHGIQRPLVSFHEHNEAMRSAELVERAAHGAKIAVVSDAGTPGISDPGARLIQACLRHGVAIDVLPGPCAITTALVGSGLPTDEFFFGGFLPVKKGRRERTLAEALARESATSVFYESPHRLDGTLDLLAALDPARLVCVARELSKKFETYHRGSAAELAAHFHRHPPRGEIVLLVSPRQLPKYQADGLATAAIPATP
jgi:16S rRNA (cytidine1402-2'-O)-methyltransferase